MEYTKESIRELIGTKCYEMFERLDQFMMDNYNVNQSWDKGGKYGVICLRYVRSGKSLCSIYFRDHQLGIWVILGGEERAAFEDKRQTFSMTMQNKYDSTETFHDGKWLFFDVMDASLFDDIRQLLLTKKKPNRELTMCGYCCDICKANTKNIKKTDDRDVLNQYWNTYYNIEIDQNKVNMYCDGCRCMKKDAHRIDAGCAVRACVLSKGLHSCAGCEQYPCEIFCTRKGLNYDEANAIKALDLPQYNENLAAFDNKSRLDRIVKEKA